MGDLGEEGEEEGGKKEGEEEGGGGGGGGGEVQHIPLHSYSPSHTSIGSREVSM